MKRFLITAAALTLLSSTAFAAPRQLSKSGYWSTHISDRASDGSQMCIMRASWNNPSGDQGRVFVKWSNNSLFFHILKSSWNFPAGIEVPLTVAFDSGVRDGLGQTVKSDGPGPRLSMIEISVNDDAVKGILEDFAESNSMTITFKSGNEAPWIANMTGSRDAASMFYRCIRHISGGTATSPVGPQATSPVNPQATSPVNPKSTRRPSSPVTAGSI